ncbi:MAG: non-canonical purine NTP pyrophosphatase, partial [Anaerovoracaceae bacterium]
MKKIIVASQNKHKIEEIKKIISDPNYLILSRKEAGIDNFPIEETGTTFEENSYIKAKAIFDKCGEIVIADDSGIEVDCIGGAP